VSAFGEIDVDLRAVHAHHARAARGLDPEGNREVGQIVKLSGAKAD
jgi:hypothetical protein